MRPHPYPQRFFYISYMWMTKISGGERQADPGPTPKKTAVEMSCDTDYAFNAELPMMWYDNDGLVPLS